MRLCGLRVALWRVNNRVQLMKGNTSRLIDWSTVLWDNHPGLLHSPDHIFVDTGKAAQRADSVGKINRLLNACFLSLRHE